MSSENQTHIEVPVGNSCTSVVQWSDNVHQDCEDMHIGPTSASDYESYSTASTLSFDMCIISSRV